jgi:hypothetical protein
VLRDGIKEQNGFGPVIITIRHDGDSQSKLLSIILKLLFEYFPVSLSPPSKMTFVSVVQLQSDQSP